MTKRVLVGLLVAAVLLGTVSTAFAASFSDTDGTKYENAVGLLSNMGVLNGFPDGTFRPAATITRAEFAAMAVRVLGLEAAAEQAKGATKFSDVPATHWASGYINIVVDQGFMHGYPDGTFRPDAPVTYAEALAVIVRLLGYDPIVKGTWPMNYLVKGAEIGVTDGLNFDAGAPATRGDVALMLENALAIGIMVQVTAGDLIQYEVSEDTLLDGLGFEEGEGRLIITSKIFGFEFDDDEVIMLAGPAGNCGGLWHLAAGLNLDDQLGLEIWFWFNEDDEIVFTKTLTKASDIISGEIEDITAYADEVEIDDKTYRAQEFCNVWNLTWLFPSDIEDDDERYEGGDATLVLDGDYIVYMMTTQFDGSIVVSDVNAKFERFDGWDFEGDDVRFEADDFDDMLLVKDGEAIALEDIQELDVGHFFISGPDTGAPHDGLEGLGVPLGGDRGRFLYMEFYDEKVSGEVEAVEADRDDNVIVTVDSEEYTLADDATMSTDDNDTVGAATEDGREDCVGNEATLYLNRDGDARHIVGDFTVEETAFAGVVKTEFYALEPADPTDDVRYFVKIFKVDGTTVRYEFDDDTLFTALECANHGDPGEFDEMANGEAIGFLSDEIGIGTYVEFALTDDGLLETLEEVDLGDENVHLNLWEDDIDADHNLVFDWRAPAGIVIVDTGEWELVPWSSFEEMSIEGEPVDGVKVDSGGDATAEVLVFDSTEHGVDYDIAAEDVGIVLARKVTADGIAVKVLVEDETATYQVADAEYGAIDLSNEGFESDSLSDIDVGDLVSFEYEGGEFTSLYEEWAQWVFWEGVGSYWVDEVNEDDLIVTVRDDEDPDEANFEDLLLDEDCIVYDVTGTPVQAELGDIGADQPIQAFDLDEDGLIEFIKIVEEVTLPPV